MSNQLDLRNLTFPKRLNKILTRKYWSNINIISYQTSKHRQTTVQLQLEINCKIDILIQGAIRGKTSNGQIHNYLGIGWQFYLFMFQPIEIVCTQQNHPNSARKYLTHVVILIGLGLLVCLWLLSCTVWCIQIGTVRHFLQAYRL